MALSAPAFPLIISAVQGSADAFVQGSVLTGLTGRQAYNLKQVALQLVTDGIMANGARYQFALTRRSKAAFPNLADPDVIWLHDFSVRLTTSGAIIIPQSVIYTFPLEMALVEETIYAQFDSAATTATSTAIFRMEVEIDTISDIDRLNLITRSLT